MTELDKYSRVYAEVNLDAILANMNNMKEKLPSRAKVMGVIKTDAYGHGAVPIAKEFEPIEYIFGYATATVEEALALCRAGIKKPVLILGYVFPYCYEDLVRYDIRAALFRMDMAHKLNKMAALLGKKAKVHIKIDIGMSRVGVLPNEEGLCFIKEVCGLEHLEIEGIFTHFSKADEADKTTENRQYQSFLEFTRKVERELEITIPIKHCANSATIIDQPELAMDMVRAGITMYGLWPSEQVHRDHVKLLPALSLKSHIVYVKTVPKGTQISYNGTYTAPCEKKIATIPVGYGDGYPRGLSNKGYVLVRGKKAAICGRICMDQFMVDVTDIEGAAEGDEVTLIGADGEQAISMEELGYISGRFNYELACDLGKRIPRIYRKDGKLIL